MKDIFHRKKLKLDSFITSLDLNIFIFSCKECIILFLKCIGINIEELVFLRYHAETPAYTVEMLRNFDNI